MSGSDRVPGVPRHGTDGEFVERPVVIRGSGIRDRLIQTASNGKAIILSRDVGNNSMPLKRMGYQLRTTRRGAPTGMLFAWCEKLPKHAPKKGSGSRP